MPVTLVVNAAATGGPIVTNVWRYGFHEQPTVVVLQFNEALDPARAQDPRNYTFVTLGGPGRGGSHVGHIIPVSFAVYDSATHRVFLYPSELLDIHNFYRLTVNGAAPSGLTDTQGTLLDGNADGNPGSNYVTIISLKTLVGADSRLHPPRPLPSNRQPALASKQLSAVAVDTLAATGRLPAHVTRVGANAVAARMQEG
jgi:hypothetical protein